MRESSKLLCRLRGSIKGRRFATIDIEARQWVNAYAVGFYDGKEYVDFIGEGTCIKDAIDHVLQPKYAGLWIYAHNGGNYDFLFFLRRLLEKDMQRRFRVEVTPVGSTVICIEVHERESGEHIPGCDTPSCPGCVTRTSGKAHVELKWTFVDSVRLMPLPLDDLGETFGIGRKVTLSMSYDDLARVENRKLMRDYLRKDCVLLYEAVARMHKVINGLGGQVGITLPATSLDLWRRKYLHEDIYTNRHFRECAEYGKEYEKGKSPKGGCRNCLHKFIRKSYFGGRSEIFRMSFVSKEWMEAAARELANAKTTRARKLELRDQLKAVEGVEVLPGTAKLYDINSHYPACMLEPMPTGEAIEVDGMEEKHVYSNAKRMTGIVECDVYIPEDCYLPPLPVVARFGKDGRIRTDDKATSIAGKLIFPTGHLTGTWDTAELCLLKRVGGKILRTRKSVWFHNSQIFNSFIRAMYKFRDKRSPTWTKGMDFIAKIIMNSAYGKFAMREDRKKVLFSPPTSLLKQDWRESGLTLVDDAADIWTQQVKVSPSYIVPQLSGHVTALARARLWEILDGLVKKGGRIYYTDTDSVVVWGVDLPSSADLGALKLEDEVLRGEFVLPKLYLLETVKPSTRKKTQQHIKVKAKGMGPGIRVDGKPKTFLDDDEAEASYIAGDSEDRAGQLSEKEFMDLVKRGVPIERNRLTKLNEGLAEMVRKAGTFPRIKSSTKQLQSRYDKRIVLDDLDTRARTLKMH
ncbi:MAG: DNA polymerase [Thiobacillus sp.]